MPTLWGLAVHTCPPRSRSVHSTYTWAWLEETSVQFGQNWIGVRELLLLGDHFWICLEKDHERCVSSAFKVLVIYSQRWRRDACTGLTQAVLWPTGTEQWHLAPTSGTRPQPGPWQCGLPPLAHLQLRFPLLASTLQHLATFGEGWHKYHYFHSAMGCSRKKEITDWCSVKNFQIRLQSRIGQSCWQWQWNWEKRRSVLLPCMHSSKFFLLQSNYIYPGDFTIPQEKKSKLRKIGFV